jgi:hypothetical protein
MYRGVPANLPADIASSRWYEQIAAAPISLACKGPILVRSVFKILEEPPVQKAPGRGTDCTASRLVHLDDNRPGARNGAVTEIVRCELDLPSAGGSEAERATRAKEGRCWTCGDCGAGKGCPSAKGKWYSDSYTTVATGCDFDASKGYEMHRVGLSIGGGVTIHLAKFEVCNSSGCFDAAYEQQKLKAAKPCINGACARS